MVYMYHSFLIHSSADGHLGGFHVLAMINSAAMNIGVHVSLSDLVSLVCMPRSGISASVFCKSFGKVISSILKIYKVPVIVTQCRYSVKCGSYYNYFVLVAPDGHTPTKGCVCARYIPG